MKIALYIEDGRNQVILTPEGSHEKMLLEKLHSGDVELIVKRGQFYACQGGWTREGTADDSTILVLEPKGGAA